MANIIVRKYDGFNRTLGKHIRSKRHYQNEMAKQGFVSWEEGQRLVDRAKEKSRTDHKPSDKAMKFMFAMKSKADKKGKVKLDDRAVDYMAKEIGVNFYNENIPKHYQEKGGFS